MSIDLSKLSKLELLQKCEDLKITKCKSKTKSKLIELIEAKNATSVKIENDDIKIENDEVKIEDGENNKFTLVDLFSGTGAFSYAFHKTNKVTTIFANDLLDSSELIFNLNNKVNLTKKNLISIKDEDIPKSNIITGGFPCQPFSIAGMKKGFDDERSNVFWKILSIIRINQPEIIILENVKNLQSHDHGKTFDTIINKLTELNYYIKYSILNTCTITTIPQNRERIYIVCFKNKNTHDQFEFDFPRIDNIPIIELLDTDIPDKYYYTESSAIYDKLKKDITKHISTNTVYQYRRYYIRENKNSVCPTLTANMGSGGHNVPIILDDRGIRKLTPKECFRLQGFSDSYILPNISNNKLYSLAGNAVSIPIIELLANKIIDLLIE